MNEKNKVLNISFGLILALFLTSFGCAEASYDYMYDSMPQIPIHQGGQWSNPPGVHQWQNYTPEQRVEQRQQFIQRQSESVQLLNQHQKEMQNWKDNSLLK